VVHVSHALHIGVSHERSQLFRVGFAPHHTLLKQEIVVLDLLLFAFDRVWGLDVFPGCTELGEYDGFVADRGFDRAHPGTLTVTEVNVAITPPVNRVQIAQHTVDDLDVFVFDRHVLVTRRLDEQSRVRKLQIQLYERPKDLDKILPVFVFDVPYVVKHVRWFRDVDGYHVEFCVRELFGQHVSTEFTGHRASIEMFEHLPIVFVYGLGLTHGVEVEMFHSGLAVLNHVFKRSGGNQEQQTVFTFWDRHRTIAVTVVLGLWE